MTLRLITAPTTYPVDLATAKLHCRVDASDEDALLTALITAATEMAEQNTGRALMSQTWSMAVAAFPEYIELTRVPVQSIASVKYFDADGVEQTLNSSQYSLLRDDFGFARVVRAYGVVWPNTQARDAAVTVEYVAGYANAAAVPASIKQWILLMISTMFENRETEAYSSRAVSTTVQMQFVDRLLDRYMVYSL